MFLKVKKADRIVEPRAIAYHLLCLVHFLKFDKNALNFFFFLHAWNLLKSKSQRNAMPYS